MENTEKSIPTGKGSPCPSRPGKVMPQAVFGEIILAGAAVFPRKNLHSRDTGPCRGRWNEILGIHIKE